MRDTNDKQTQLVEKFKKEKRDLLSIIKNLKNKLPSRVIIPEGLTLQEEAECTQFIVQNGGNILTSCTLPYFVKYILDLPIENTSNSYVTYAYGLFLQHRLFTQSDILLESLLLKFNTTPENINSKPDGNQLER